MKWSRFRLEIDMQLLRTIPNNRETAKLQNCPGSLQRPRTRVMALIKSQSSSMHANTDMTTRRQSRPIIDY